MAKTQRMHLSGNTLFYGKKKTVLGSMRIMLTERQKSPATVMKVASSLKCWYSSMNYSLITHHSENFKCHKYIILLAGSKWAVWVYIKIPIQNMHITYFAIWL